VPGDIEITLAALTKAGVKYLVVGGVAVVMHGHLRVTADLDLVLWLEKSNLEKAVLALETLGFRPRAPVPLIQFADIEIRESWIRDKGLTVFSLWSPSHLGFELDLFVREPFDFERVYARAERVHLESCVVTVIPIEDLIALKESVGRPRDLEDVAALRMLSKIDGKHA
jgi:predicted nucleotidyltransferase